MREQLNMKKFIVPFLCIISLFIVSCGNDDEPEILPIRFDQHDYTIRLGVGASISYTNGGGVYELTASNPEVLGKFGIDLETHRLLINPASIGESTLTITDVKTNSSVTQRFVVEDFYLSFRVEEIDGKNYNPYLIVGCEIRFIRDEGNTKRLNIYNQNHVTHETYKVAEGAFDIEKSETNIFTLNMALHHSPTEELETFNYTMGGDGEYLNFFDKIFEYNWDKSIASKSQPVKRIEMILTSPFDGCKISCSLQPF